MSDTAADAQLCDAHQPSRRWPLPASSGALCVIGREPPADLVIAAAAVSRRHAAITMRDGCHWIHDLGSRNGTFVNGKAIGGDAVRLIDGDEVVIAGAVALRFVDPTQTTKHDSVGRLRGIWLNAQGDVFVNAVRVDPPVSAAQTALLRMLFDAKGQYVTRDAIAAAVWPNDEPSGISDEAIDGLIKRLRARLRDIDANRDYIEQLRGRGIRLRANPNGPDGPEQ